MTGAPIEAIVAGHICLDLIPQFAAGAAPRLEPGSLTRVGPAVRATGGAVSNVGLALHRLGVPAALVGKVGEDLFGDELLRLLEAQAPHLAQGMVRAKNEVTSYSIVISPPGVDRQFLHCPGANDTFGPEDVDLDRLPAARLLHFGYPPVMRRIYADGGQGLRTILSTARTRGLATSLDMCSVDPTSEAGRVDWHALLANVLPEADLFVPSFDELHVMLRGETPPGDGPTDADAVQTLAHQCLTMGAAVVMIKLGEHGLYLRTTSDPARLAAVGGRLLQDAPAWCGRELWVPCFEVDVVSATGSGDCTIAGLLAALLRGEGPEQAGPAAAAVGASGVEAADATSGIQPWPQIEQRMRAGWHRHRPATPPAWREQEGLYLGPADGNE